ncbi:MAG: uroporphyrinogen decarboxylase family protein [Chloroflexota bacterium]
MNSRERVLCALDHVEPDRVPYDLWVSPGCARKLERATGASLASLREAWDVDLDYIEGPAYIGPPLPRGTDGSDVDLWGVRRAPVTVQVGDGAEVYMEVTHSPLAAATTPEEVLAYPHWPLPDWFDYGGIAAQCRAIRARGRAAVFQGDRLNRIAQLKPALYLRGVEAFLMDLRLQPELCATILERIQAFYCAYAERILEAAEGQLDLVLTGDDFGSQRGPLISPALWVQFLGEGFRRYVALAHAYGLRVMHHTCGAVWPIIPLMIERGLDVLQSLQPEAEGMDAWALKATYGARLAFHGGISIQRTLPCGTPDEIRREVRDRIAALAPGGGYILGTAHNIQADAPVENVLALLAAYRQEGRRR